MFNYATETAYSKGTQNDYRFGFFQLRLFGNQ